MNRYTTYSGMLASLLAVVVLTGCQGTISQKEPIHINPNMDWQERFEAQEANPFFADGRAMRAPVKGTVARGFLKENDALWTGENGFWIVGIHSS